jgi:hypothetical protein
MTADLQIQAIMLRQGVEAQRWLLNRSTTDDVVETLSEMRSAPLPHLVKLIEQDLAAALILEAKDRTNIGAIGLVTKERIHGVNTVQCDLELRAPVDQAIAEILATKLEETAAHNGSIGRCSVIRISADGPFPCPRGYDFEAGKDDSRIMARQVGAHKAN